jgi:hypothetical protein
MSLVFQNIAPSPSPPGECVPPAFVAGGGQTRPWMKEVLDNTLREGAYLRCPV